MEKEKGFRLFDNYDDDGQFRLFDADFDDWDEDWEEETPATEAESVKEEPAKEDSLKDVAVKEELVGEETTEKSVEKKEAEVNPVVEEVMEKVVPDKPVEKVAPAPKMTPPPIVPQEEKYSGPEIRVRYCSTCGKLLFVKEDASGYSSECNHCEIKYFQKAFGASN